MLYVGIMVLCTGEFALRMVSTNLTIFHGFLIPFQTCALSVEESYLSLEYFLGLNLWPDCLHEKSKIRVRMSQIMNKIKEVGVIITRFI